MKVAILEHDDTVLNIIEVDSMEHADLISVGDKRKVEVNESVKIGDTFAPNNPGVDTDQYDQYY